MSAPHPETTRARVVISHGRSCMVMDDQGQQRFCLLKGRNLKPVCGDWVAVDEADHVLATEPRENEFPRVDARGRRRVVAANLDRVLVVVAPHPAPSRHLLDRYLLACHAVGIDAAVLINKADMIEDNHEVENVNSSLFAALGYPLVRLTAKSGDQVEQVAELVGMGTAILVGQSGVGKSTIANCLVPDLDVQTRELSTATGKGRHTTTTSTMYRMPAGGFLIDSPGVWEFGIWHLSEAEVEAGFIEFSGHREQCRFNDCRHLGEPDCGVTAGVDSGDISFSRYQAYQEIIAANRRGAG